METLARALAIIVIGLFGLAVIFSVTPIRFEDFQGKLLAGFVLAGVLLAVSAYSRPRRRF